MVRDLAQAALFLGRQHRRSILTVHMAKRTKSSQLWLERQRRDPYVKKAAAGGLGSRAHFKLAQLDERFALLRPQHRCSNSAQHRVAGRAIWQDACAAVVIVAVDYRPMPVPRGVVFLCLDIYSEQIRRQRSTTHSAGEKVGPCFVGYVPQHQWSEGSRSGRSDGSDRARDADRDAMAETCAAHSWSRCFRARALTHGSKTCAGVSSKVTLAKPAASRAESREVYGIATGFTGDRVRHGPSRWPLLMMCSKLQINPPTDFVRITH